MPLVIFVSCRDPEVCSMGVLSVALHAQNVCILELLIGPYIALQTATNVLTVSSLTNHHLGIREKFSSENFPKR